MIDTQNIILNQTRKIRLTGLERKEVELTAQTVQKSLTKMGIKSTNPIEEKIDWADKQWTLIVNCENKDLFRLSLKADLSNDALKNLYYNVKIPFGIVLDHEDINN